MLTSDGSLLHVQGANTRVSISHVISCASAMTMFVLIFRHYILTTDIIHVTAYEKGEGNSFVSIIVTSDLSDLTFFDLLPFAFYLFPK